MSLGYRLLVLLSIVVLVAGLTGSAYAAQAGPTRITLDAQPGYAGTETTLQVLLAEKGGAPVANAQVSVERRTGGAWAEVGTLTTDQDGRATQRITLDRASGDNVFRATYAGDEGYEPATTQQRIDLKRRGSRVRVGGPSEVKDGRTTSITVRWTTTNGQPVAGRVKVHRSLAGGPWKRVRTLTTGDDGRATLRTKPRQDSRWRARAVQQAWVKGDRSAVHRLDNIPPGRPVKLPKAAPNPRRKLPVQPRAVGKGPNLVVSRISDRVWADMAGVTWRRGCPVGRSGLRMVRVNYWDYGGYPRRGELIAAAGAAGAMGSALAEMYQRKLPIRAMYRVDRFGWGKRSRGGNDYASMSAGNTSAFNCRDVTGRPGVRSPHSYGRSLDVNTWENPYRSARGIVPNTWWQSHSHPRVAWRSRSHPVVRLMARHGFRWTYGNGDTQHFDYVGSHARAAVAPRACDRYCD
jgi:5-hydroxyisourate hydrolase-like protein (transthyretin family)